MVDDRQEEMDGPGESHGGPQGEAHGGPQGESHGAPQGEAHGAPQGEAHGAQSARLLELLGLSEDELCQILDADPLTLLSGQLEHRPELPILLDLLADATEHAGPAGLRSWARLGKPGARPLDMLLRRDFPAFEVALDELAANGFVIRGGRKA